ncbi:HAD-IIA family hydrolase [Kineosporia succinea]|uniref:HAD superfamily hydrolase (TIGR01450 family) n=1 Tax=Kineosporia succinea TaxID=84632 RepID=A0ABT9P6M4_9ACTN|nr:HAD-IIA family hydrolase [Kineosporia succinea]MDP9828349.1 HAD superfamily hydrolase (TIGR01450 family) [Kineosporia succinea]
MSASSPQATLIQLDRAPSAEFDTVLLDLDGVVYIGPKAVPGAPEALERVRAEGTRTAFVTNNASRPPRVVAEHLRELGVHAEDDDVVNSAQAASALFAKRLPAGSKILVVGGQGLYEALEEAGLKPVGSMEEEPVAVVQGFTPDVNWKLLVEGTRAVRAGLPWIATNMDATVPTPYGPAPGNGTMVEAVVTATQVQPEVAGKPQPTLFLEAAARYGSQRTIVVGDRLDTDLEGARSAEMVGMIVLTGVHRIADLVAAEPHVRPHLIARDLGGLMEAHAGPTSGENGSVTVGTSRARVENGAVTVLENGDDALDLARAGVVAAWAHRDATGSVADHEALLKALYAMESEGPWGR